MKDWNVKLKFVPRGLMIGVYWVRDGSCLDVYAYPLPFFRLHFSCWGKRWGMPSLDQDDR